MRAWQLPMLLLAGLVALCLPERCGRASPPPPSSPSRAPPHHGRHRHHHRKQKDPTYTPPKGKIFQRDLRDPCRQRRPQPVREAGRRPPRRRGGLLQLGHAALDRGARPLAPDPHPRDSQPLDRARRRAGGDHAGADREGRGDHYILRLNQSIAGSGQVVYIRLMPEMNGAWNPYGADNADGSSRGRDHSQAQYRQAWRRFSDHRPRRVAQEHQRASAAAEDAAPAARVFEPRPASTSGRGSQRRSSSRRWR